MVLLFQHPLYYHQRMYFLLFLPWYEYEWFRIYSSIWLIFVPWTSRCFRTIIAIFYCIIHRCYYTNVFCIIYLCIAYFPYNGAQFSNITSLFFFIVSCCCFYLCFSSSCWLSWISSNCYISYYKYIFIVIIK